MKGLVSNHKFSLLHNNAATDTAGSDVELTEIDTGGANNGTIILVVDASAASDAVRNLEIWTSRATGFCASGTQLTAVASDSTRQCKIKSDTGSLYAIGASETAISDLTVSTYTIDEITEDGVYAINVEDLARYVSVQYDSSGTGSSISAVFIGECLDKAPWPGARSEY